MRSGTVNTKVNVTCGPANQSSAAAVRLLPQQFEIDQLGCPVFRLELPSASPHAALDDAGRMVKDVEAGLVSCRVDSDDTDAIQFLKSEGFREIEVILTFERKIGKVPAFPGGVEIASADAADACREIARTAFRYDRFHMDTNVPREKADALKAEWAYNNAVERADICLVAVSDAHVVGFNQCFLRDEIAVIDLIAVSPQAQGAGHGRRLVQAALAACGEKAGRLRVGTQETNVKSVELYRSFDMKPVSRKLTFHRWSN